MSVRGSCRPFKEPPLCLHQLADASIIAAYCGLCTSRPTGQTLREAGLATHYLPSAALPQLLHRLRALQESAADPHVVDQVLREAEESAGTHEGNVSPTPLMGLLPAISRVFGRGRVTSPDAVAVALGPEARDAVSARWVNQTTAQMNRCEAMPAEAVRYHDVLLPCHFLDAWQPW